MKRKKIFIYYKESFCIRRSLDANKIRKYLLRNDYEIVDNPAIADVIIFVTCASLDTATKFSLEKIKEFQKYDAELIVAGCLPEIEKEKLAKIFNGNTISTKDLDKIDQLFPENKIKFSTLEDENILFQNLDRSEPAWVVKKLFSKFKWIEKSCFGIKDHIFRNLFGNYSRIYRWDSKKNLLYHLRVSWGCSSSCSYCGIKKAIGPPKSKPIEKCVKEFKKGLNLGYKEFVINADDIGAYGLDIGSSLPKLLDALTRIPGEYQISILDFSPRWVIKYIDDIEEILKRHKIVRLDIPIQSGSSRILKLMHRFSDVKKMKNVFLKLKKSFPDLFLDTRIIIGFPSETEKDFQQTLNFIKEINFFSGYIYRFALKTGTEAEKIEPKTPKKEINRRARYAKKFLTNKGYDAIFLPKKNFLLFQKTIPS